MECRSGFNFLLCGMDKEKKTTDIWKIQTQTDRQTDRQKETAKSTGGDRGNK